jgi:hypothetical protein
MNWFQRLWSNPNVHILGALASGAASVAFPAYAGALQVAAGILGGAGVLLPEQPGHVVLPGAVAAAPPVIALPPAAGGGAYHAVDYANLAAALLAQFVQPPAPPAPPK